jgi:hypothetical protein
MPTRPFAVRCALVCLALLCAPSAQADDKPDLAVVHRIKAEAFGNGKVMDHLFWLTDANGPRLTGSPGLRSAAEWAQRSLKAWGASNPRLEKWGAFGRGWSLERFSLGLEAPYTPIPGVVKAWSGGSEGPVSGELALAPLFLQTERADRSDPSKVEARIAKYLAEQKGKLRGKIVLLEEARDLNLPTQAASTRYDDPGLAGLAAAPAPVAFPRLEWPITSWPADPKLRSALQESLPLEVQADLWAREDRLYDALWAFLKAEGALAALTTDGRGDGGLIFTENAGGWWPGAPVPPPVIQLSPESYDRLARLAGKKVAARVALDVQVKFHDEDPAGFNVVAELPGGAKKDEVVMIGAHLDSWHGGTGATDNGAGSAVMLEVVRILSTLGLKLDRTVRIALWSGEEQGLFGSRGYVKEHFGDPVTMALRPEHQKLSVYFNLDNGTGKIRGVYLQGNDMARPIFESWLAPFRDLGVTTISIRNTGGTDHESFDGVGLPGFQFIQDPLDYGTRTHHSTMDVAEHAQAADLMQASAVIASLVYEAANRKEAFPRKPLPKALPPRKDASPGAR